jgi:hypothetical protein
VRRLQLTALVGATALQAWSCSDPPKCQTADCSIPGSTVVKWEFDHYPELGFPDDSCGDVGAVMMHVEANNAGDPLASQVVDTQCGDGQATFVGLAAGMYDVSVTPLDVGGNSLVTAPVTTTIAAAQPNLVTTSTVEVPYTAWTTAYTGTFLFRETWGGATCSAATPVVTTQLLALTAGGQLVTAMTNTMHKIDGTDPEACQESTAQFPEFVAGVAFGPASLHVIGKDAANAVVFDHVFDTFVGAAKNNPTLTFDTPPPVDAGVPDAPVDAGSAADAAIDAI